jgi:hypothetical protein
MFSPGSLRRAMGWLDELQVSAGLSAPPLTSGTLVVFASGAARAGRVQEEDLFPAYRVWSWVGPPRVLSSGSFRGWRGAVAAAAPDRRDRLAVAWVWHPGDHPVGGAVTHGRGRARAPRRWPWCWADDHPGAAGGPAVSAPVVFLGVAFLVRRWRPTSRMASSRRPSPLRPAAIAMLGPAGRWAYPLVPTRCCRPGS